ncbi:alpha/beta fold hydrolase [candidate division KSB1 bacterium]|nr:alpha/beta fold hydrolase [candidate division KSB1 bacterium]
MKTNMAQKYKYSSIEEWPIQIYRGGVRLIGMMHHPDESHGNYPAVMLLHGFTGHKSESHFLFTRLARALASSGVLALRFDFAGSGDSDGNFRDMTIESELDDARAAFAYLSDHHCIDRDRIGVLGLSLGGCVASLLAGETETIKSLALISAIAHPKQIFSRYTDMFPKMVDKDGRWYIDRNGFPVGDTFFHNLSRMKPLDKIAGYKNPALIIHGKDDLVVPVTEAQAYADVLTARNGDSLTEVEFVDGADHVFASMRLSAELIDRIVDWFLDTLL